MRLAWYSLLVSIAGALLWFFNVWPKGNLLAIAGGVVFVMQLISARITQRKAQARLFDEINALPPAKGSVSEQS